MSDGLAILRELSTGTGRCTSNGAYTHTLSKTHALLELIQHKMWDIIFPDWSWKDHEVIFIWTQTNKDHDRWAQIRPSGCLMTAEPEPKPCGFSRNWRSCENWWIQRRRTAKNNIFTIIDCKKRVGFKKTNRLAYVKDLTFWWKKEKERKDADNGWLVNNKINNVN